MTLSLICHSALILPLSILIFGASDNAAAKFMDHLYAENP